MRLALAPTTVCSFRSANSGRRRANVVLRSRGYDRISAHTTSGTTSDSRDQDEYMGDRGLEGAAPKDKGSYISRWWTPMVSSFCEMRSRLEVYANIYRRVLMFPNGNNVDFASFYLEHGYEESELPEDFACCVQFALVLWNPEAPWVFATHTAHHRFTKEEGDWGFTRFVELRKLWAQPYDESGHYLATGQKASMTAYVKVVKDETGVLWHNFNNYDSKKETGFVGLKNQGATCYLNSLLQSLYFTNAFRKVSL